MVLADVDAGSTIAQELVAAGHRATGIACDVSDEPQVVGAVEHAVQIYGWLDFAYNNTGVQAPSSDFVDLAAEEFDRVTKINQRGIWACMKHELKPMRAQG